MTDAPLSSTSTSSSCSTSSCVPANTTNTTGAVANTVTCTTLSSPSTNSSSHNDSDSNNNNNSHNGDNNSNTITTTTPASAEYWFVEDIAPGLKIQTVLHNMVLKTSSEFQSIEVLDTYFGRTLITDGKSQSSAFDEYAYHESLVHPAMVLSTYLLSLSSSSSLLSSSSMNQHETIESACHSCTTKETSTTSTTTPSFKGVGPRSVLIGGGGELATAREVLRWKSVERVVMVDLDGMLVDICQQHLPEWGGQQVMQDERFQLIIGDAYQYVMNMTDTFDVIIMDISDPIEIGPGIMLYVKEFYQHVVTRLNAPHGVFVTQAGLADSIPLIPPNQSISNTSCFAPIRNTLQAVFPHVIPYSSNIPSFGSDWGFVCAHGWTATATTIAMNATTPTNGNHDSTPTAPTLTDIDKFITMMDVPAQVVDDILEQHVKGDMRLYDGITHQRLFHLTKPLRQSLLADTRIMTKDDPIFMY